MMKDGKIYYYARFWITIAEDKVEDFKNLLISPASDGLPMAQNLKMKKQVEEDTYFVEFDIWVPSGQKNFTETQLNALPGVHGCRLVEHRGV